MTELTYKGYTGSIEISEEDNILYGKVVGVRDSVSYEGKTASELIQSFHEAVDDYLKKRKSTGTAHEHPRFGKPSMTNLPGELGRSVMDNIMHATHPDRTQMEKEVEELKERILQERKQKEYYRDMLSKMLSSAAQGKTEEDYLTALDKVLSEGFPDARYSFGEYAECSVCLEKVADHWIVYVGERGNRYDITECDDIMTACLEMIRKFTHKPEKVSLIESQLLDNLNK